MRVLSIVRAVEEGLVNVDSLMFNQVCVLTEAFATARADVGFLSGVNSLMTNQM